MTNTIDQQLRDLKFQQRLEQVALVSRHDDHAERIHYATALIRELAMHRVFDRFSKQQEQELLDRLQPLASPLGAETPAAFGDGAFSNLDR